MEANIESIIAVVSTTASIVFAYLWFRRREVVSLAFEISKAYSDKKITQEELDDIIERLEAVINKSKR
jgi:hypothetical protein